ncbi:MAG: hypothetical protein IPP30_00365 [Flavobacterium sp.]|nr:hypothetical protein [Flavobacterium sp.]
MKIHFIISIFAICTLTNCSKSEESPSTVKKVSISGFVQKGPFLNGTSITISELNASLGQTGKTFNTQITDNRGSFEVSNIELVSNFVSLKADGFYYNEVLGEQSSSQITLYALSDISDKTTLNTNVLSHLEKARVEYLIGQGLTFRVAKKQAQGEILAIFNIDTPLSHESELLDISQEGNDNAVLLALSAILQGYRTESEFIELLSNISSDIKTDGVLNSASVGSQLINHAVYLNSTKVRRNLEERYTEIGMTANIPDIEIYINNFINNTDFVITKSLIEYPEVGAYGPNILQLDLQTVTYSPNSVYSLTAILAKNMKLKITVTSLDGRWFSCSSTYYSNWLREFLPGGRDVVFTASNSNLTCDQSISISYGFTGQYRIDYYENDSTVPTRSKIVTKYPS